jgi:DNA-binding transcriptional ArsR family regulator
MPQGRVRTNAVFAAVVNPERRRILDLLKSGGKPAGELVAAFPDLPQPAVSRHLRILREAGLVAVSPRGQRRIYSLRPDGLREVDSWVCLYRRFWEEQLGSLAEHLEKGGTAVERDGAPGR